MKKDKYDNILFKSLNRDKLITWSTYWRISCFRDPLDILQTSKIDTK